MNKKNLTEQVRRHKFLSHVVKKLSFREPGIEHPRNSVLQDAFVHLNKMKHLPKPLSAKNRDIHHNSKVNQSLHHEHQHPVINNNSIAHHNSNGKDAENGRNLYRSDAAPLEAVKYFNEYMSPKDEPIVIPKQHKIPKVFYKKLPQAFMPSQSHRSDEATNESSK